MSHDDDRQVNAPDGTPVSYDSHVPSHREAEPLADPGIEPHEHRITDIDPKAADRVERQVAAMFTLAGLLALGSCVAYFAM